MAPARLVRRLARAPGVHFLLLGGALFVLAGARPTAPPPSPVIAVTGARVEELRRAWAARHGVPPDPSQEAALVGAAVDDEVLHREALAAAIERHDPLVRTRLVQLARFLDAGPLEDEQALEEAARDLGLARTDVIVRRHLGQAVRLLAAGPPAALLPTEAAVAAYYDRHRDAFAVPGRIRLTQVYLSADRRGAALEREAAALLDRLRREHVAPQAAPAHGDPFARGAHLPAATDEMLDLTFGPGAAAAIAALPEASWSGPVRSTYGLHLVWVHERHPASTATLAAVRGRIALQLLRERRAARVEAVIASLRRRYTIRVGG